MENDNIKGVTLRVAVFFGLTTFTLCIAIFYIEGIIDDKQDKLIQKDSLIQVMEKDLSNQEVMIKENERQIRVLKDQVDKEHESALEEVE